SAFFSGATATRGESVASAAGVAGSSTTAGPDGPQPAAAKNMTADSHMLPRIPGIPPFLFYPWRDRHNRYVLGKYSPFPIPEAAANRLARQAAAEKASLASRQGARRVRFPHGRRAGLLAGAGVNARFLVALPRFAASSG